MATLSDVIKELCPNNNWKIINDELIWKDDISLKPSEEVIQQKKDELNNDLPMKLLREKRNELLNNTDKYFVYDWPHKSEEDKNNWLTYRQELRDLPNISEPNIENQTLTNVNWPTPPG